MSATSSAEAASPAEPAQPSVWQRWRPWLLLIVLILLAAFSVRPIARNYFISQAKLSMSEHRDLEALEILQTAQKYLGRNGEIDFLKARIYRHQGNGEMLMEYLKSAQQLGYDKKRIEQEWLLAEAESGILANAEAKRSQMLVDPGEDLPEICAAFVKGYCIHLQFEQASQLLQAWQSDMPESGQPYALEGMMWQARQEHARAEQAYERATELDPNDFSSFLGLAKAKLALSKTEEAEKLFRDIVAQQPENFEANSSYAQVLTNLGKFEEAQKLLEDLLKQRPGSFEPTKLLGQIHLESGNAQKAIDLLKPLADIWPDDADLNYSLGRSYTLLGQADQAKPYVTRTAAAQAQLDLADKLLEQSNAQPENAKLRSQIGLLMMRYRSRTEGLGYLRSALMLDPNLAEAHQGLADYYRRVGETANAAKHEAMLKQITSAAAVPQSP